MHVVERAVAVYPCHRGPTGHANEAGVVQPWQGPLRAVRMVQRSFVVAVLERDSCGRRASAGDFVVSCCRLTTACARLGS